MRELSAIEIQQVSGGWIPAIQGVVYGVGLLAGNTAVRTARHVRIVVRSSEPVKRRWRAQEDNDGSILNGAQRGRFEKITAA